MLFKTAFRIIIYEKEKFSGAVAGVALATFLMILQCGFYLGYQRDITVVLDSHRRRHLDRPEEPAPVRRLDRDGRPPLLPDEGAPRHRRRSPGWSGATPPTGSRPPAGRTPSRSWESSSTRGSGSG